MKCKLL